MSSIGPNALDLFSGAGGMALGFKRAGFRVWGGIDANEKHVAAYQANFPDAVAICADVATLDGATIRQLVGLADVDVDVVFGGPPCQGFSIGGLRALDDPRNALLFEFLRIAAELETRYFVIENVSGLMERPFDQVRERLLSAAHECGYSTLPFTVLDATEFGIPQRRKRVFVLGYRKGERSPRYPLPRTERISVGEAISDLEAIDEHLEFLVGDVYTGPLGTPTAYSKHLRVDAPLTGCRRTAHTKKILKRFKTISPGERDAVSRFLRLDYLGVAPTLRAGTGPERGSFMAPRPIHPALDRCITVREAARLHSFPDDFVFHEAQWHAFMQIGNSVPPLLAEAVAKEVLAVCLGQDSGVTKNRRILVAGGSPHVGKVTQGPEQEHVA